MPEDDGAKNSEPKRVRARQTLVATGSCAVVLGMMIAVSPQRSVAVTELLFGAYLLLIGVVQILIACTARFAILLRVLVSGSGLLSIGLALLCVRSEGSELLLALWVGFGWAVRGITQATVAVWSKRLPDALRHELLGLLTVVAGGVVVVAPYESVDGLAMVVGGCLTTLGVLEILTVGAGRRSVGIPAMARVPMARN